MLVEPAAAVQTGRSAARNFFWLALSHGITLLWAGFGAIYLAHVLGPAGLGKVGFAQAVAAYLVLIVDSTAFPAAREVAARQDAGTVPGVLLARLIVAVALGVPFFLIVWATVADEQLRMLLWAGALSMLPTALSTIWAFLGLQRGEFLALGQAAVAVLYIGGLVLWVREPSDLLGVPLVYAAALGVSSSLLLGVLLRSRAMHGGARLLGDLRIFRSGWTVACAAVLSCVLLQFDTVALGLLMPPEIVGLYNAAARLQLPVVILVAYAAVAIMPALVSRAAGAAAADDIVVAFWRLATGITLPLAVAGTLLAGAVIPLLYGPNYLAGAVPLSILSWTAFLAVAQAPFSQVLLAQRSDRAYLRAMVIAAGSDVLLCFLLIPVLGMAGAALATVGAWIALTVALYAAARQLVPGNLWSWLVRPAIASAIMGAVLVPFRSDLLIGLPLAAAVYLGAGVLTGTFDAWTWRAVSGMVPRFGVLR